MKILFQTSINYRAFRHDQLQHYVDDVGQNTGNLMFTTAMQWMLEQSGEEVLIDHVLWEELPSRICSDGVTHLVLNCSNWVRPSNEMLLKRVVDACKAVTCPIYFIGLGVNASLLDYERNEFASLDSLNPIVKELIQAVENSGGAIGLRGYYSKAYFDSVRMSDCTRVTGCPSICQFGSLPRTICKPLPKPLRSVALNGQHLFDCMGDLQLNASEVEFVCQDWSIAPLLFPEKMRKSDWRRMLELNAANLQMFAEGRVRIYDSIDAWCRYLSDEVDCVVGTRIHGGLVAVFSGVPALFLNWDSRLAELTDLYGLPSLNAEDWDGSLDFLQDYKWDIADARFKECRNAFDIFCMDFGLPIRSGVRPNVGRPSTEVKSDMQNYAAGAVRISNALLKNKLSRAVVAEYLRCVRE